MKRFRRPLSVAALALAPLFVSACTVSTNPVSGRQRAYAYTWQQEVELGREADREIVAQFGTYDDAELQAYVERVGESILATSHLRRPAALPEYQATDFTFRVLDSEIVNAFALPGGYVYVTRGLLAHLGMQLMMFRYSRDDERESDRLGVEYAARAGYQAAEGAHFFTALRRMQQREGWFPGFLSTHPDPGRREQTIQRLAAEWAAQGLGGTRVERDGYLARIDGMVLGMDPRQGFEEGGVFYHPAGEFSFTVPRGWAVAQDGRQVQLAPDEEEPAFAVFFSPTEEGDSPSAAAAAFVAENELGVQPERTTINGFTASRVEATAEGEDDGSVHVVAYWVQQGDQVREFLGIADMDDARAMENALNATVRSFRRLTDPDILEVRPGTLRLTTITDAAPFRELVDEGLMPAGMDLEDLAIMNGVGLDDEIPAGTRLKLPS